MALLSRWQGTDPPLRPLLPPLLPFGARLPSYTTKAKGNRPEASGRRGLVGAAPAPVRAPAIRTASPTSL